jgi:hypothetical protein
MFPITMSFTVSTQTELDRLVAAAKTEPSPPPSLDKPVQKAASTVGKQEKHAQVEKPAPTPPTAPEPAAPEASAAPSATEATEIDFATQIQKPIVALAATGKRDAALALLKELGAARASDIKPEDYARAVELIAAAQAG